jgi:hypothetical protein
VWEAKALNPQNWSRGIEVLVAACYLPLLPYFTI